MRDNFAVIIIAIIALLAVIVLLYEGSSITVRYDCRLAEISVDYPAAVKQECRKLMEKR